MLQQLIPRQQLLQQRRLTSPSLAASAFAASAFAASAFAASAFARFAMSSIKIDRLRPLESNESPYVRPLRLFYRQVCPLAVECSSPHLGSRFLLQDGKERTWDCIKVHDSVSILLFNVDRGVLIFVKQFRPAVLLASSLDVGDKGTVLRETSVSGYTLELCAGIMDKDGKSVLQERR